MNENMDTQKTNTPIWFWGAGVIALLWNLIGLMAFVVQMTMTEETMAALSVAEQEIYKNMPAWVWVFFAVAVVCGVVGSALLLMRKKLAVPVLILSLIGVIGHHGYLFFLSNSVEVMGAAAIVMPALVVLISIALVPFAISFKNKTILR